MARDFWELTRVVEEALDAFDHSDDSRMPEAQKVAAMTRARALADRMVALATVYTDLAARSRATEKTTGTPLPDYLATTEGRTPSEANGLVHQASRMSADPRVRDAALAGDVSPGKAAAIAGVLGDLPRHDMTPWQRKAAAERLLEQAAGGATTRQIAGSADRVLEQVAPDLAPSATQKAAELERRRRRAVKDRGFHFAETGQGSIRFWGQLPDLEGAMLRNVVGACVERGRGDERRELESLKAQKGSGQLTPGAYFAARTVLQDRQARTTAQRQADALTDMVAVLQDAGQIPAAGGETPRVVITLDYTQLLQLTADAAATGIRPDGTTLDEAPASQLRAALMGTAESGAEIPASQVRLACCDAGILPVVLGTDSQILDVGREHRLVTAPIRKALNLRDGGCVFPSCTVPAPACQAHHVTPWWAGGTTALGNLVLVCRHHHGIIEPHRYDPAADQWRITFTRTGQPVIHPPRRLRKDLPPSERVIRENSALPTAGLESIARKSQDRRQEDSAPRPETAYPEAKDQGSGVAGPQPVQMRGHGEDQRESSAPRPDAGPGTQETLIA